MWGRYPYEILTKTEISSRFPAWTVPEGTHAIYSDDCGILRATECVQTLLELAAKHGAVLHDECRLETLDRSGAGRVTLRTSKGSFTASQVALCTGAWTANRCKELGIALPGFEAVRILFAYWPIHREAAHIFDRSRFPVFIHFTSEDPGALQGDDVTYGFPEFEKPGYVKVALHHSSAVFNPDEKEHRMPQEMIDGAREYMAKTFPGCIDFSREPIVEPCIYANTQVQVFAF